MPSSNFQTLHRVAESVIGVTPANPVMERILYTGEGLSPNDAFFRSQTITGDRIIAEHLRVGEAVQGNVNFEAAQGYWDWLIELALFDRFAAMAEAYNQTADSNVTDITGQVMTAAGDWVEGMLIQTSGLAAAGNNVRFRAAAGTGSGSITAPAATFASDDAAPQAGARALAIGVKGTTGEISATATGLSSSGLSWLDFPIAPGVGVKIKGFAGNVANNAFVTVGQNITANDLPLDDLPAGWGVDAGAGVEIELFIGDFAETSDDVLTDTVEKTNAKMAAQYWEVYRGLAVNSFSALFALNTAVTGNAQINAFRAAGADAGIAGATYQDPAIGLGNIIKTGSNIARLTEGGVAVAGANACQRLNLTLNNNLTPVGDLTSDSAIDYDPGDAECIIEADYRFANKTFYDKFRQGTVSNQLIVCFRGTTAYLIKLAAGVYTSGSILAEGRNGQVLARLRMEGQKPAAGLLQDLVTVTRFRAFN